MPNQCFTMSEFLKKNKNHKKGIDNTTSMPTDNRSV